MERIVAAVRRTTTGRLGSSGRVVIVAGMAGSARALLVAALERRTGRPVIFVTGSAREAEELQPDVEFFHAALGPGLARSSSSHGGVVALPSSESDPYDGTSPHAEVLEQRALYLYRAAAGGSASPRILITSIRALAERTVPPDVLKSSGLALHAGDEMPIELIVDLLISSGYVRQEPIGSEGEFSSRGGILDVFSAAHEAPHRIEFFGDVVESIREFDVDSQRSTGRVNESIIAPMRELCVRREEFMSWAGVAREKWPDIRFKRDLQSRLGHAGRGEPFPGWEYLLPLTRPLTSSALDYFDDALIVIDEPAGIEKAATDFYDAMESRFARADDAGELALRPAALFLTPDELGGRLAAMDRVELRLLGRTAATIDDQFRIESLTLPDPAGILAGPAGPAAHPNDPSNKSAFGQSDLAELPESGNPDVQSAKVFLFPFSDRTPEVSIISQSAKRYRGRVQEVAFDAASDSKDGRTVLFIMPSSGVAERVRDMLAEYGTRAELRPALSVARQSEPAEPEQHPAPSSMASGQRGKIVVSVGKLANGFVLPSARLSLLVESDVFGDVDPGVRQRPASSRGRRQRSIEAFLSDLGDLKVGDYVVHVDHGIGQFQGLNQIPFAASSGSKLAEGINRAETLREFMLITYAEGARLYVPVERLDLIQRFGAAEGHKPTLDRLGGVGWQKTKTRVRRAMRDMAEELLKLYAERKLVGGYSYGPDTPWQREFEDAFEYPLTPDQETTVDDLKSDMQKPVPMDRLIVGDVGYGKTEVAIRAAFKAIMEGKQVAVLTPTTVLAYQHFETFRARFAAFPVKTEMLSRFRNPREQKEAIKVIESGGADIVIGTHRLLSKDVQFKDLGLLVIDEEQRFGVAHKERIKQMRKKVDVISMSATPIPRTLNMSLAGMRDISVIETPPRDRLAIQTHVVQFSEAVIRGGVELELQRGGQVFFVHNRVETIVSIAELIHRLVPNARIGVGHGQMNEKELEDVMLKFIHRDLDILVSTTIIENGIDIPLANTIIVNRADMYGLSQLYQLRGRVGRSSRRAYAYLLIPSEEGLTPIARRRLAAIREFSDLGSGFRIAALDLELRGAGNLLGSEQSGHIDAVGFDLYTQMLDRTVRDLKGETVEEETLATVNLGVDIRVPQDYIYDMSQRLRVYKRVSSAASEAELADVHAEVEDRYGPIPEPVENLFEYARLRREASELKIISIDREGDRLAIKFSEKAPVDPAKLMTMISSGDASFTPSGVLKVELDRDGDLAAISSVKELLRRLR